MKAKLLNLIMSILGLLIFTAFIWFRFVRERLPKDIPFNLSIEGLFILLWICMIYLYIIYTLSTKNKLSNAFLNNLINNIFKPLEALDHSIKNHRLINPYYKRFIIYLSNKLDPILHDNRLYYYTFAIFPRLVLVTALWIDVFWFHKLFYIYKVLLIGILLILNRYIIYSLKYAKEHFITQLEPLINTPYVSYDHEICTEVYYNGDEELADDEYDSDTGMRLELRDLIKYQTHKIVLHNEKLRIIHIFTKDEYDILYCKKHNIPFPYNANNLVSSSVWNLTHREVEQKVENILKISVLIWYYELHNEYIPEIKRMKILIFTNYLLCWSYILIISIHTLPLDTLSFLLEIIDTSEPFNGDVLDK